MQVGGGHLSLGAEDSLRAMTAEVTAAQVTPSVEEKTARTADGSRLIMLSQTTTYVLEGTAVQSFELAQYLADNDGAEVPFRFTPSVATGQMVEGRCVLAPIEIGGEVGTNAVSEFSFRVVGEAPAIRKIT